MESESWSSREPIDVVDFVDGFASDATRKASSEEPFSASASALLTWPINWQSIENIGRGGPIRTDDPLLPKQMRYQAAPRPDFFNLTAIADASTRRECSGAFRRPCNALLQEACIRIGQEGLT